LDQETFPRCGDTADHALAEAEAELVDLVWLLFHNW